jgi:hypothetical protein
MTNLWNFKANEDYTAKEHLFDGKKIFWKQLRELGG